MGTAVSARRRLVFILWPYCTDRIEKKKREIQCCKAMSSVVNKVLLV